MSVPKKQDKPKAVTLDKPRMLIVDDSRTMRASVQRLLGREFDVLEANDVDAAWDLLTGDGAIQVVFVDLMMPDKNGFQLLRQMRESPHERLVDLPVIVITGHDDSEKMKRQAMLLGATDFISKPFDSIQLKARAQAYARHQDTVLRLQEAQARLTKGGTLDTLTGLANRRYFSEHGPSMLSSAAREKKNLAVLRLDVDNFEVLFRQRGKLIADKVLLNISKIINACVREEDGVARIGLAKFAIVMPSVDREGARHVAERIHKSMQKTVYRHGDTRFRMTASSALVTSGEAPGATFNEIVKLAEQRLAEAARRGGDRLALDQAPSAGDGETAEPSPPQPPTIDEALALLNTGQGDRLRDRIKPLMAKLYPLMVYGNRELSLGLDDVLTRLRKDLDIA